MLARSVLVTGSNRGLGFELINQLASQVTVLIATCRCPDNATELQALAAKHQNIQIVPLDVSRTDDFENFAQKISSIIGNEGLSILINNAAIDPEASKSIAFYSEEMAETYSTNVISPAKLIKACLPLLISGAANCQGRFTIKRSMIVNMSSRLGSITNATNALELPYRCSKAALNMLTKCLSHELKPLGVSVFSIHPGWVQTDMGGTNAELTKHQSIQMLIDLLKSLNLDKSGHFFNWKGEELPW